jgi:hypothetical protein
MYARLGSFKGGKCKVSAFSTQDKIPQQTQTFVKIMPSSNPANSDSWQFSVLKRSIRNGLIAGTSRDTYDIQVYASKRFMGDELGDETTLVDDGPALNALVSTYVTLFSSLPEHNTILI